MKLYFYFRIRIVHLYQYGFIESVSCNGESTSQDRNTEKWCDISVYQQSAEVKF